MDVGHYVDRMEQDRQPAALERLRADIDADEQLPAADKSMLFGRIGMYLADADREEGEPTPDSVPDEEGEDASA